MSEVSQSGDPSNVSRQENQPQNPELNALPEQESHDDVLLPIRELMAEIDYAIVGSSLISVNADDVAEVGGLLTQLKLTMKQVAADAKARGVGIPQDDELIQKIRAAREWYTSQLQPEREGAAQKASRAESSDTAPPAKEPSLDEWVNNPDLHPQIIKEFKALVEEIKASLQDPSFDPREDYKNGKSALELLEKARRNVERYIQIEMKKGGDNFEKMVAIEAIYLEEMAKNVVNDLEARTQEKKEVGFEAWKRQITSEPWFSDLNREASGDIKVLSDADLASKLAEISSLLAVFDTEYQNRHENLSAEENSWISKQREGFQAFLSVIDREIANREQAEKDKTMTPDKLRRKRGIGLAVDFFEGGYGRDTIPNYENLGWLDATPERLTLALWNYVEDTVMEIKTSGDNDFIDMDLFGWTMPIPESPTLGSVIESFSNLALAYADRGMSEDEIRNLDGKFRSLSGKLSVDIARIQQIYKLGRGVHANEGNPEGLIAFLRNQGEGNVISSQDLQKITRMGLDYQDKEGEVPHQELLLWAHQAWMFMHDPEKVDVAVLDDSTDEKPVFARNVLLKSSLTTFPTIIEGNVSEERQIDALIKRNLIRSIVGKAAAGTPPPWISDPEWGRKPGETLSQLSQRRLMLGRAILQEELFGQRGREKPDRNNPNCFYWRWEKKLKGEVGHGVDLDEEKAAKAGFRAEQQTNNLMEYYLMPAKAEGLKETSRSKQGYRRLGKYREIVGRTGPTADFYIARGLVSPQMYSRKLLNEGGGDGSHGPENTKDKWFKFFETMIDRYYYIPDGEMEGQTLREAIINCDSGADFANIEFSTAIGSSDATNLPWQKQLELGWNFTQWVLGKGFGVNWHNVVMAEPGSGGATVTFNPQIAELIKSKMSRNAYYMLTRDYGRQVASWQTEQDWANFRAIEDKYLEQLERGVVVPVKPATVSQEDWDQVIEYNKKPTSSHQLIDGKSLSDKTGPGMVRYAANVTDMVWIPNQERDMNSFEREVILGGRNDYATIIQKLIVGNLFMGDVFRNENQGAITSKDIDAFFKLFSYDYWKNMQGSGALQAIDRLLQGRKIEKKYTGLGYFSPKEVEAMLDEAAVGTGLATAIRGMIEDAQKFGG